MRSRHEVTGFPAADGVFCGPLFWIDHQTGPYAARGSSSEELLAFSAAIGSARQELEALSFRSPEPASDLLAVQLAWLDDAELIMPVERRILAGDTAANAWRKEIAGHASAIEDEAFADVRDIEQRVLKLLYRSDPFAPPKGAVLAGRDISPSQFLETDWSEGGAILLEHGSVASHAAILARGRGVPMIVGTKFSGRNYKTALVDGSSGRCVFDPETIETPQKSAPTLNRSVASHLDRLKDYSVELLLNINSLDELSITKPDCCDGIGLVRSEFLFGSSGPLPEEDEQSAAYSAILKWAEGKPVTIRLFDLGGDKPNFGLPVVADDSDSESRGISLLLNHRDLLTSQLRALVHASSFGDLRILLPMVVRPEQLREVRSLLQDCAPRGAELPQLGVMVEVLEVARHPERFGHADFFALGTNDLTQFITGRSRRARTGSDLSLAERNELFGLMAHVKNYCQESRKALCLCGDLVSDLNSLEDVLKTGLRTISVPPLRAIELAPLRRLT